MTRGWGACHKWESPFLMFNFLFGRKERPYSLLYFSRFRFRAAVVVLHMLNGFLPLFYGWVALNGEGISDVGFY